MVINHVTQKCHVSLSALCCHRPCDIVHVPSRSNQVKLGSNAPGCFEVDQGVLGSNEDVQGGQKGSNSDKSTCVNRSSLSSGKNYPCISYFRMTNRPILYLTNLTIREIKPWLFWIKNGKFFRSFGCYPVSVIG